MKLLDQVTAVLRRKHDSLRTEKTYKYWIRAVICFHPTADGWRHPVVSGVISN